MKSNLIVNYNPSFGKVIPVKKIVFSDDDSTVKCKQLSFDTFESQNNDEIDNSCTPDLEKKVIQALDRILSKNDGAEINTYQNAFNNMVRRSLAQVDGDYKIPLKPVDSSHNAIVKPLYATFRNYILTGQDARKYAAAGRNIGGAKALSRENEKSDYMVERSKSNFAHCKEDIITDSKARLKNEYGGNMGLVIYADTENVPKKGHKGFKTEINIKGIDFEPV